MKADERHELETNALAQKLSTLAERAKSGQLVSFKVVGVLLVLLVAGGLWWYLARETRRANSVAWKALDGVTGPEQLDEIAKANPDSVAGRVARLQHARTLLGPDGIQQLPTPERRQKGIENVEAARAEFAKLADEFKNDLTLRAQCIDGQAHAELSLVGIPQEKNPDQYRGDVAKAAALFREFAKLVGEGTEVGKETLKKADALEAKKDEVLQVAKDLHTRLTPTTTAPEIKFPDSLTPKAGPPAGETPKAPEAVPPPTPAAAIAGPAAAVVPPPPTGGPTPTKK